MARSERGNPGAEVAPGNFLAFFAPRQGWGRAQRNFTPMKKTRTVHFGRFLVK